jgi:bifunctional oligoribonuclease and PAP phosphatase NrnA
MKTNTATTPATDLSIVDDILTTIRESHSFCLSGHQNPDGDVIGSELAMASLIRRMNPKSKVDIMNAGPVPKSVSFLPGADNIRNVTRVEGKYDVVMVFECSGADRMGGIIDFSSQVVKVVNIDHHLHNPNFGHINFVEPTTSSTAELIFKIAERSGLPIQKNEAICMYTGVVTDTGWFRYGNTNVQTLEIAAKLLAAGVPVAELSERVYLSKSETALRLLAWVLSNMTLHFEKRVALLHIPERIFKELGAHPDDLEEVVNQGLQVETVVASAFLKEKGDVVKVSLRSKGDWDINRVARAFGGGGHKNASGCSIQNSLEGAKADILRELQTLFPG